MQEGKNGPLGPTVLLMLCTSDMLHSVFKSKTVFHDCTSILTLTWFKFLSLFRRERQCVISSPRLHLQRLFLFPAMVHRRLRVDAPGRRRALAHQLFASLCICAPPLRLPPLCSAVLKPNLRSKTIGLTKLDPFAPVFCLFSGGI